MTHWFLALLAGFIHTASPLLKAYGLWAVFGLLLIENAGVVFAPGEATVVTAGFLAAKGILPTGETLIVAILASTLGGYLAYGLGARYGHQALTRFGKYVGIRAPMIEKVHHFFQKLGAPVVLIGRFLVPLRQLQGYLAGASAMGFRLFALWSWLGAVLWIGAWGGGAFLLAQQIPT